MEGSKGWMGSEGKLVVAAGGERKGEGFSVSTPPPASRGDILLILRWVYLAGRGGRVTAALKCTARLDEHDGPALPSTATMAALFACSRTAMFSGEARNGRQGGCRSFFFLAPSLPSSMVSKILEGTVGDPWSFGQ